MSLYKSGVKKINGLFGNVNEETKKIASLWANKDGAPVKVFSNGLGERFIILGDTEGNSYYSLDGRTWKEMSGLPAYSMNDVIRYKDRYICVGGFGDVYQSIDGKTWKEMNYPSTDSLLCIATDGNRLVVIGASYSHYCTDGETWNLMSGLTFGSRYSYKSVVYGGDRFVILDAYGRAYYSIDGVTWIAMTGITKSTSEYFKQVIYGQNCFVVVGKNRIYYSLDGATWTKATLSVDSYNIYSVIYAQDKFFAFATEGIFVSSDGITWEQMGSSPVTIPYVSAYRKNLFICGGNDGQLYYSTDCETWTETTGHSSDITYKKGYFG